jgi:uncharacterized protein YqgV (UPF0045/DUF77 family)
MISTVISAQVSLYPLRQERLGPTIEEAVAAFRQHGVDVSEGVMSTMLTGEAEAVWTALRSAFAIAAAHGAVVMVATVSNGCPVPVPSSPTP